jgi:hypothetical protein
MSAKQINLKSSAKRKLFNEYWDDEYVLLHIDSRNAEVIVPENLKGNFSLTLKISQFFQGETEIEDEQITSYLKFDSEYFKCVIPWDSIWGMTGASKQNKIWAEDLPKEVLMGLAKSKLSELSSRLLLKKKKPAAKAEEK